jgi:hypothetical protein
MFISEKRLTVFESFLDRAQRLLVPHHFGAHYDQRHY